MCGYDMNGCEILYDDLLFWEKEVESSSSLEYIILKSSDEEIKIDIKEMSKIVCFKNFSCHFGSISGFDFTELGNDFRDIILEKTGHDIFGEKQANARKRELN